LDGRAGGRLLTPHRAFPRCTHSHAAGQQVLSALAVHPGLGASAAAPLAGPSLSLGATTLYGRGVFEAETRANLGRTLAELLPPAALREAAAVPGGGGGVLLTVNDKKLHAPRRVLLRLLPTSSPEGEGGRDVTGDVAMQQH
jgi:hypothetical protein